MNRKRFNIIGILVVLIIIFLALVFRNGGKKDLAAVGSVEAPTSCPTDIFICPNNERVSRVLPSCQFAVCPVATNPVPAAIFKD